VAEEKPWERPFDEAIEIVRRGLFDEVKAALQQLGVRVSPDKRP